VQKIIIIILLVERSVTVRNDKACSAVYKVLCQYLTVKTSIRWYCKACSHLYSLNKLGYLSRII
jgi:hypothetical protein